MRTPLSSLLHFCAEQGGIMGNLMNLFTSGGEHARRARPSPASRRKAKSVCRTELPPVDGLPALPLTLEKDGFSSLRLRVRPNGDVILRAPRVLSDAEALRFARQKRDWIERKRAEISARPVPAPLRDGSMYYDRGEALTLRVEDAGLGRTRVERQGTELWIRGGPTDEASLRRALRRYREREAKDILPRRLEELHLFVRRILGDEAPTPDIVIRELKSRWGSCARRKHGDAASFRITLALRLMALPPALADYVMLHELCHMRHMNHGAGFHALLERVCPGHRAMERALREV